MIPCCHWMAGCYLSWTEQRPDSGQSDFFRAWLDQIVQMGQTLARLALTIDLRLLEEDLGAVYSRKAGSTNRCYRVILGSRPSGKRTVRAIRRNGREMHG